MKHTPGPWQANFEHHARDNDAQFMVCRGDNHPLAVLSADGWVGIGERKANSRLIAAAPELLDALVMALESLDAAEVPQEWDCRKSVRSAIAKATGSAA
jgi:hypothetical protein